MPFSKFSKLICLIYSPMKEVFNSEYTSAPIILDILIVIFWILSELNEILKISLDGFG